MRVLLISDWAATGFGRVGRELAAGLAARGHDLRIIAINWRGLTGETEAIARSVEGPPSERWRAAADEVASEPFLDRIIAANAHGDGMGHNLTYPALTGALWQAWKPEAAIIVADPKAMMIRLEQDGGSIGRSSLTGVPVYNYVPIEGTGLPEAYRISWRYVKPVAMSDFGKAELERLLGQPVDVAYHGVSRAFRPLSPAEPGKVRGTPVTTRDGAKAAFGFGGRTLILRADRYTMRKNYPALFRVMRPVLAKHPEAVLFLHTVPMDDLGMGNVWELMSREPGAVHEGGPVWRHPQIVLSGAHDSWRGLTDDELRCLYAAADLYVSPTMAEGFGLCLAESLACGTPVVATDYSAIPEVVGPGGFLIPPTTTYTNPYAHEWALVDEARMTEAVERLVSKPSLRRSLGAAGRKHVARFTWDRAVDVFDRLITQAAAVAA